MLESQLGNKIMNIRKHLSSPVIAALGAAILFGGSTPIAKALISQTHPILLAGLLYLGSGMGLILMRLIRNKGWHNPGLLKSEGWWLIGAIAFGGIMGPVLLMMGLTLVSAASASLLLNLEAVLTALIAWIIFKENTDHRIVLGMLLIVVGGIVLSWPQKYAVQQGWLGTLAIAGACLCWAIDNNLTRKISASDSLFIAGSKGLIAGIVNISLACGLGLAFPAWSITFMTLICGFIGYGLSLLLFILALRGLGTARTGAYFSVAPFIGTAIAIVLFHEKASLLFWMASVLMGAGVWLHLTERHAHEHHHEALLHEHWHAHDEHHQHMHDFPWDKTKGHKHSHQHEPVTHSHAHYPDVHHRHKHSA